MHLLTALILLTASVFAAPMPQEAPAPTAITHLYICTDSPFKGQCTNLWLPVSKCQNLDATYAHQVSSAGPDEGTFCTLYSNNDCDGEKGLTLPFTYPGIRKLSNYDFDNKLSSVRCDFIAGWRKTGS
ncbi:hypothetical protein ACN47E_008907 [Coniothyrium glycines]